jgi:hypothetical protein
MFKEWSTPPPAQQSIKKTTYIYPGQKPSKEAIEKQKREAIEKRKAEKAKAEGKGIFTKNKKLFKMHKKMSKKMYKKMSKKMHKKMSKKMHKKMSKKMRYIKKGGWRGAPLDDNTMIDTNSNRNYTGNNMDGNTNNLLFPIFPLVRNSPLAPPLGLTSGPAYGLYINSPPLI